MEEQNPISDRIQGRAPWSLGTGVFPRGGFGQGRDREEVGCTEQSLKGRLVLSIGLNHTERWLTGSKNASKKIRLHNKDISIESGSVEKL